MNKYAVIKFLANVVRSAKETTMPAWLMLRQNVKRQPLSGKKDGITVSLTAIPTRIDRLWVVLDSLMRQTCRPDRIIIALTEPEFPEGLSQLPDSLKEFISLGVEIVFLPFNLKCHNKYYYALQNCGESCVITVDDDCWYSNDTISRLMSLHTSYPDAVVSNIARVINKNHFCEYKMWKKSTSPLQPSHQNVALGFGAVLYPPHFAKKCAEAGHDLFDTDLIKKLAPTADDLWLKANEMVSDIKVACGDFYPNPVTITGSQKISLRSVNKGTENRNNTQWSALDAHFHLKQY